MKSLGVQCFASYALLLSCGEAATVYLAGDSTMAKGGGGSGVSNGNFVMLLFMLFGCSHEFTGWGEYLGASLSIPVVNNAIGGRSARSFTREARFSAIASKLQAGDFVIVEFGHNDGGSLATDNGRTDCPGSGSEVCKTTYGYVICHIAGNILANETQRSG